MNKKRIFPFGYRMTEGQIDLNAEEAEVIRFIFQKYSEGLSVPKLTERIQAFNVPYREGSRWNKNMVCRILDNKIYLGNGEYPPIIEKCLFPESVKFSLKKNQPAENRLDSQSVMTFESRWGAFVAPGQLPGVKKGMQNKPPAVSNVGSAAGFSCRVL